VKFLYKFLLLIFTPFLFLTFPKSFFSRIRTKKALKQSYWLHCSSLGEVNATIPFIQGLKKKTDTSIVLSVFTKTGYQRALKIEGITVIYLPLDFVWIVRHFFKKLNPQKIFIMETELWANFLLEAHNQKIKTYIINARLSEKSSLRYKKYAPAFFIKALQNINYIYCQSAQDKQRFLDLQINEKILALQVI
jgi:3-deoxy-D-manno-octulosonic-acid transferase